MDRVDQWVDQFMNQPVPRWLTATLDLNNIINDNEAPKPSGSVSYSTATDGFIMTAPR